MIYTIIFYLILIFATAVRRQNQLKWVFVVASIYYGIRYNYMPDYESYHQVFNLFASPNYIYDSETEHVEIGWYYLNRLFSSIEDPYGFFVFVFVCSVVFAYGVYRTIKSFDLDPSLFPIIMIGYFSAPTTAVLCSAQRQFLVTGIILIAYSIFIYGRILKIKDLWSQSSICFYVTVCMTAMIHTSAFFLLIVPLVHFFPSKSKLSMVMVLLAFIFFSFFAKQYLPYLMKGVIDQTGNYEYLEDDLITNTKSMTIAASISYIVQIFFCAYSLSIKSLNVNETFVITIALLSLMFSLTGYYVPQINRLSLYINLFTYISIAIIIQKLPRNMAKQYRIMMWIFIIWNFLKILQPMPLVNGRDVNYKTIFEVMF